MSLKKITATILCSLMIMPAIASASPSIRDCSALPVHAQDLQSAYNLVQNYGEKYGIDFDLSYETFVKNYNPKAYNSPSDYANSYISILEPHQKYNYTMRNSSGSNLWHYNTGTVLPHKADYSSYNLLSTVKKGDILFEASGGFGITAHVAIVEGIYYSEAQGQYYIRLIEAISNGISRSVLDDERFDDRQGTIYRVSGVGQSQIDKAVDFAVSQIGKNYMLDFKKDTSPYEKDWYCSELAWASYKNQGIDIEEDGFTEPGVTPRDLRDSDNTILIPCR
jgi:hypothetical protein